MLTCVDCTQALTAKYGRNLLSLPASAQDESTRKKNINADICDQQRVMDGSPEDRIAKTGYLSSEEGILHNQVTDNFNDFNHPLSPSLDSVKAVAGLAPGRALAASSQTASSTEYRQAEGASAHWHKHLAKDHVYLSRPSAQAVLRHKHLHEAGALVDDLAAPVAHVFAQRHVDTANNTESTLWGGGPLNKSVVIKQLGRNLGREKAQEGAGGDAPACARGIKYSEVTPRTVAGREAKAATDDALNANRS